MRIWVNKQKIGTGSGKRGKLSALNVGHGKITTDVAGAAPPAPPPIVCPDGNPTNLTVTTVSDTTLYLTWTDNSTNEDGFSIERSTDGITFAEIDTVPANSVVYFDTTCVEDTQYWYRIRAYVGTCYSDYTNTDDQWTYTVEAQDWWDAMTTAPSVADKVIWNTMIKNLITSGVWAKLDQFVIHAIHTNAGGEALINVVNPGVNDAAEVNAPAWTQYQGFTGANLKYIETNFQPDIDGVNYQLNDGAFFFYERTAGGAAELYAESGVRDTAGPNERLLIFARYNGNAIFSVNDSNITGIACADASGFWIANRLEAGSKQVYRNNLLINTLNINATALPGFNNTILAYRNGGVASNYAIGRQIATFGHAAGLLPAERLSLMTEFETVMDAHGTGCIP